MKLSNFNKLNGWQRIWVMGVVLWGISFAVFQIIVLQEGGDLEPREKLELRRELAQIESRLTEPTDSSSPPSGLILDQPDRVIQPGETDQQRAREIQSRLDADQSLLRRQVAVIGLRFSIWLAALLALYALGWAIAWLRRGFRGKRAR